MVRSQHNCEKQTTMGCATLSFFPSKTIVACGTAPAPWSRFHVTTLVSQPLSSFLENEYNDTIAVFTRYLAFHNLMTIVECFQKGSQPGTPNYTQKLFRNCFICFKIVWAILKLFPTTVWNFWKNWNNCFQQLSNCWNCKISSLQMICRDFIISTMLLLKLQRVFSTNDL